ncbi:MAG TPA: AbrB/MazE/SpoVT family DNA-binding domain-containing protein [Anaerolineae bacterium]|nr:AbrB/MazE/SpoVT family DNA-binding domain-containing protein [Anaerolineae bacterium]
MEVQIRTIETEGIIRIPLEMLRRVGIHPGERVMLRADTRGIWLGKQESVVDRLTGRLALDPELATEIIESPELENAAF